MQINKEPLRTEVYIAFLVIMATIFLFAACGGGQESYGPEPRNVWFQIGRWSYVTEITLSDGTPCAVSDSDDGGSIDCDWSSER